MGSQSDFPSMKFAVDILNKFNVLTEVKIISAHRTPKRLYEFATSAESRGIKIIIAGAGGAAHLPGMVAALTNIPVLGVPIKSTILGIDSLLSIVQMPKGTPVATFSIGDAGAQNAALFAIKILALQDEELKEKLTKWQKEQEKSVKITPESRF